MQQHLQLDRTHANLLFTSWKLTRGIVKSGIEVDLSGCVATQDGETDFIHTRLAALYNHLIAQPGGLYLFVRTSEGLSLQQLQQSGDLPPSLVTMSVLQDAQASPLLGPALPPSVAEVLTAGSQPGPALLVSTGQGDLRLLTREAGGVAVTAAVHPLHPPAPLEGARTFQLEAAVQVPGSSDILCVLWAIRQRTDTQPARCEVFAVTLAVVAPAGAPGGDAGARELHVTDVKLLKRSSITPHGVLMNPTTASILLVLEPVPDEAPGTDATPAANHAAQPFSEPVDDSGDPVSPRTLQAAVARLAQFTSQEPASGLPPNQWADLYSESGPDGVGDLGQEPSCTLYFFNAALSCVDQVPCLPHKVLTCHRQQGRLMMGLTDDVDCALVELATADTPTGFAMQHAASVPALAYVTAGKLQRKFLLLAPPGGPLAAALVEAHRYAYLYRATQPNQKYGEQEVLEMGIPEGTSGVLGGALEGSTAGGYRLLLLTSSRLRVYELC